MNWSATSRQKPSSQLWPIAVSQQELTPLPSARCSSSPTRSAASTPTPNKRRRSENRRHRGIPRALESPCCRFSVFPFLPLCDLRASVPSVLYAVFFFAFFLFPSPRLLPCFPASMLRPCPITPYRF